MIAHGTEIPLEKPEDRSELVCWAIQIAPAGTCRRAWDRAHLGLILGQWGWMALDDRCRWIAIFPRPAWVFDEVPWEVGRRMNWRNTIENECVVSSVAIRAKKPSSPQTADHGPLLVCLALTLSTRKVVEPANHEGVIESAGCPLARASGPGRSAATFRLSAERAIGPPPSYRLLTGGRDRIRGRKDESPFRETAFEMNEQETETCQCRSSRRETALVQDASRMDAVGV